jgi:hypothetical protein
MRSRVSILTRRTYICASVSSKDQVILCSIESLTSSTRILISTKTSAAIRMACNTCVIPYLTKVAIRTYKMTRSIVEIIVDYSSNILTTWAVSSIISTSSTWSMTRHTSIYDILSKPTTRTCITFLSIVDNIK